MAPEHFCANCAATTAVFSEQALTEGSSHSTEHLLPLEIKCYLQRDLILKGKILWATHSTDLNDKPECCQPLQCLQNSSMYTSQC